MKKLLSLVLLATAMFACEEGVVITVPTGSSYSFDMTRSTVNSAENNISTVGQTVDVTTFINEDAESIESIKLDKLTYEFSGYNNTSGDIVLMDLTISTRLNGTTNPIMSISGLIVEDTGLVLAFEDGNPASALSAAQVASLESIMDNLQPFELLVTADFSQDIDSDFKVNVAWELTASVAQPTTGGG